MNSALIAVAILAAVGVEAGSVAGRVTRATDGLPVAGARIYMKQTGPAISDADGRYELRHNLDGYRSIWINADGLSIINRKINVSNEKRLEDVDFVLEPSFQIRGRVVDEQGDPVADARVYLSDEVEFQTQTDAAGRFHLDTLMTRRPSGISAESPECDEFVELERPSNDAGTLVLCRRSVAVIAGMVFDAQGKPADSIRVWLCPEDPREVVREFATNDTGRFRFPVPGGRYQLLAYNWQQTQAAVARNIVIAENQRQTDWLLYLTERPEISGNTPLRFRRKELTLQPESLQGVTCTPYWFFESAKIDSQGRFHVRRLLPGRYRVTIFSAEHEEEPLLTEIIEVTEETGQLLIGMKR